MWGTALNNIIIIIIMSSLQALRTLFVEQNSECCGVLCVLFVFDNVDVIQYLCELFGNGAAGEKIK